MKEKKNSKKKKKKKGEKKILTKSGEESMIPHPLNVCHRQPVVP